MRILTPCPPRAHCKVCEGRLNHQFGGKSATDPGAKYRHQAADHGQRARGRVALGDEAGAYGLARKAATYAMMATA